MNLKRGYLPRKAFFSFTTLFLVLLLLVPCLQAQEIIILHTNDIHGRIEEDRFDGMGLPRMAVLVQDYRDRYEHVLLLDGGDTIHGKPIVNLLDGVLVVEMMNVMGYDAMVVGNHDFNYGYEYLMDLQDSMDFSLLGANVYKGGERLFNPYLIKEVADKKIGIFGLATPETTFKTHPGNIVGLEFRDIVETAKEMVEVLKGEGVDLIVALAHLGLEGEHTSEMVASEVSGLHLIVDGHSHHALEAGLWVGDTLIVQTGEYTKNLGVVTIDLSEETITLRASLVTKEETEDVPEDEILLSLIEAAKDEILPILREVVGKTQVPLVGEREYVRYQETNLGNLVADSMRHIASAQIALNNGGGIRASLPVGDISIEGVISVLPFGNSVVAKRVKGEDVLAILEKGVSYFPESSGAFLQVSGISFSFDAAQEPGQRVQKVMVDGTPLDTEEYYIVSTNNFLAAGGDGFGMFEGKETVGEYDLQDEVLVTYLKEHGEVAPAVEGRITVLHTIKPGETLDSIAGRYALNYLDLAAFNKIDDPDKIFAGKVLTIPMPK